MALDKRKPYRSCLAAPDMISNFNSLAIVTSSTCEPWAIVTSHWSIVLTLYLWTLSSSQWRCQPGRFSMAAHRHDRRRIYRSELLRFHGRIEIDHSYGLRNGRPHSCCAGHRENVPSAKVPQMRMSSLGNVPNFSLTPIWPGYPQLGCYEYHQPIVLGSLWWRLWLIAID